jgi:2-oxoglutarate ferredoxin oxidoreductase subunit beta
MSTYKRADFVSQQEVRWCPGCGDYAILSAVQKLMPELDIAPENTVFISGIGCAGRFPYYMNTYGFHTIHGRAPAVATGLKMMRDDLSVWIVTGDGDGLSIGTNHLIHCLRRNLNVTILLFNNQIYGLTKGQFSPTSPIGQTTKTSPTGVVDAPLNPTTIALASGASFVARAIDKDPKNLAHVLKQAHQHQGASFVEIYQNCNIFNDGVFDDFALKENRSKNTLMLENEQLMSFGTEAELGLHFEGDRYKVTGSSSEFAIHDSGNKARAYALSELVFPEHPIPVGVLYQRTSNENTKKNSINKNEKDLIELFKGVTL